MLDRPETKSHDIGFNFDNSYSALPKTLYKATTPETPSNPCLIIYNDELGQDLGLNGSGLSNEILCDLFSGACLPEDSNVISQAYAGHQFGGFTNLGDGRAHLLGEHVTPTGKRFDIQFKGSGRTPYSRSGDGKAALGPMLREYIISEALHSLNIPTTRSLAVTTTGDPVVRQDILPGAVLTRIADSHIRVGTFQYLMAGGDTATLKKLADYVINRHYSHLKASENPYQDLLKEVMARQIDLIANWMRVGFIHGVMNTDNMLICGETIDYGPCAFMDHYDKDKVFSSIDRYGRYSFSNQPDMALWNLTRFAETLLPLMDNTPAKAIEIAEDILKSFNDDFNTSWQTMMNAKLGLSDVRAEDGSLVQQLLDWMHKSSVDYTNTFRDLSDDSALHDTPYQSENFKNWYRTFKERQKSDSHSKGSPKDVMQQNNPVYIPRNHKVEEALYAAEVQADLTKFHEILQVLKQPYREQSQYSSYQLAPTKDQVVARTFCGT
ncbi:MAG: YdiU family protein [Methylocystaceae bacterium]|nr:YdiU family protein [Methylocystaceae bacterium]